MSLIYGTLYSAILFLSTLAPLCLTFPLSLAPPHYISPYPRIPCQMMDCSARLSQYTSWLYKGVWIRTHSFTWEISHSNKGVWYQPFHVLRYFFWDCVLTMRFAHARTQRISWISVSNIGYFNMEYAANITLIKYSITICSQYHYLLT